MNVILRGQELRKSPREIAKEIQPLIGLTDRQAAANQKYREKIFNRYRDAGMSESKAAERAEKAALKYAAKQHRYRAETIVLTENAYAYNRGAHMSVCQSIADGYMGRCAMIWTTAGTNRVCSCCLALKDTVVGYTDELGVLLPPLHPRCRCAIMYDEVGTPRAMKPKPTINPLLPASIATETISPATPEPQATPQPELSGAINGALNDKNDPDGKRREAHAEIFYAARRNSKKTPWVRKIAENSGMSEKAISKIFDHVFINEHDLWDGHHRFYPSYYMAESFRRLSEGKNIQPHDLLMLKHEWLELGLMKRYGYDYDTAHEITERKYNYSLALKAWRKEYE